jgi:hypothetical protein
MCTGLKLPEPVFGSREEAEVPNVMSMERKLHALHHLHAIEVDMLYPAESLQFFLSLDFVKGFWQVDFRKMNPVEDTGKESQGLQRTWHLAWVVNSLN